MNLVKLSLLAAFFIAVSFSAQAQNVKQKFKHFTYVDYYLDNSDKNQKFNIIQYIDINETGFVHLKLKNNVGILDTVYRLPDTLMIRMNNVFDGNKQLKSLMIKDKYPEGTYYGGSLHFLKYTDYRNISRNFTMVPPFMDQDFNDLLEDIIFRPSDKAYKTESLQNKIIESEIAKSLNASKYALDAVGQTPVFIKINSPK
ncbi:MAG TPA: hypothetical protein VIM89_14315 [Mucilaginibacter sp.]